jgi:hypothetical protein
MNIVVGNNEELVNCQLLQVSKFYIVQSNAFVILSKKYMKILRKYAWWNHYLQALIYITTWSILTIGHK